jgi:spermidine synthase
MIGKAEDGRLAVLGNAAGTTAVQYDRFWPTWKVDGVEIDGTVSQVGYDWFDMGSAPNLEVHTADARPWLQATDSRFDGIVIDAYRQPYIPFHLVTLEFFELVRDRLLPGGAVMINVGAPPGHDQALERIAGTMAAVFPRVEMARVNDFNTVVTGYLDAQTPAASAERAAALPGQLGSICTKLAADTTVVEPGAKVLTDDLAPVEWLTDTALIAYLQEGAPGAE